MSDFGQLYQEAAKKRGEFESRLVLKSWEDDAFRKEFIANPKKMLEKELGQPVPENVEIRALEETGNRIYFIIPQKPAAPTTQEALTEEALSEIAAGLTFVYQGESYTYKGGVTYAEPAKFLVWF